MTQRPFLSMGAALAFIAAAVSAFVAGLEKGSHQLWTLPAVLCLAVTVVSSLGGLSCLAGLAYQSRAARPDRSDRPAQASARPGATAVTPR
jgi:hypothetical protein